MSDLTKIMEVLSNQKVDGVLSGDWSSTDFELVREVAGGKRGEEPPWKLVVRSESVGFFFTADGRFIGIFNWKD